MSIKETVKQALTDCRGNNSGDIADMMFALAYDRDPITPEQVKRAFRDLPHVRRVNGRYVVKGRRVPPKPIAAPMLIDNAPALTREALESLLKAA